MPCIIKVTNRCTYGIYHFIKNTATLGREQMTNYGSLQKAKYYRLNVSRPRNTTDKPHLFSLKYGTLESIKKSSNGWDQRTLNGNNLPVSMWTLREKFMNRTSLEWYLHGNAPITHQFEARWFPDFLRFLSVWQTWINSPCRKRSSLFWNPGIL